jgi:hypothetical protein
MAWTYGSTFLTTTAQGQRNIVRLLAQENQETNQRVQDEEIDFLISEEANLYLAAARVADLVAGRAGPISSKSVGGLSVSYGAQHYTELAASLRTRGLSHQTLEVGGTSRDDHIAVEADTDRPAPAFTRTRHDYDSHVDPTDERHSS